MSATDGSSPVVFTWVVVPDTTEPGPGVDTLRASRSLNDIPLAATFDSAFSLVL